MSSDSVARYGFKPVTMAAVAGGLSAAWRGTNATVPIYGNDVPLPLLVAGATLIGAEVAALTNEYLFSHLPLLPKAAQYPAHTALNIGIQASIVGVAENMLAPGVVGETGVAEIVGIAALAEITSSYLVDTWFMRWYEDSQAM